MLWFLYHLLREGPPATCYWIVPVSQPEAESIATLVRSGPGEYASAREREFADYYLELLENERHAKECVSGLIAVNVRIDPAHNGRRSIRSNRIEFLRQYRS